MAWIRLKNSAAVTAMAKSQPVAAQVGTIVRSLIYKTRSLFLYRDACWAFGPSTIPTPDLHLRERACMRQIIYKTRSLFLYRDACWAFGPGRIPVHDLQLKNSRNSPLIRPDRVSLERLRCSQSKVGTMSLPLLLLTLGNTTTWRLVTRLLNTPLH